MKKMFCIRVFLLLFLIRRLNAQDTNCTDEVICASNAECIDGECMCESSYFSPTRSNTDCRSTSIPAPECDKYDPNCIFCGSSNEGPCMWCTSFLNQGSCVENCTGDFKISIIPAIEHTATVCEDDSTGSTSIPQWAIIVIIVVGVLILVTTAVIFVVLIVRALSKTSRGVFEVETSQREGGSADTLRTKRSNSFAYSFQKMLKKRPEVHQNIYSTRSTDVGPSYDEDTEVEEDEDTIEGDDETVFKYKVNKLRPQSQVFLQMLNDMRRRSKELPEGSPAEEQYRKVIRDVTRLLYMLNKKPSRLQMPPDGVELMRWSQKILRKYQATQDRGSLQRSTDPGYMSSGHTGTSDENVFLGKLAFLRDHSDVFLRMLNELRRKLKELRPDIPMTRNYKAMTKDLTRLLDLMNKDQVDVQMPCDGLQLVNKAENLLDSYLAGQGFTMNYEEDTALEPYREDTTNF